MTSLLKEYPSVVEGYSALQLTELCTTDEAGNTLTIFFHYFHIRSKFHIHSSYYLSKNNFVI